MPLLWPLAAAADVDAAAAEAVAAAAAEATAAVDAAEISLKTHKDKHRKSFRSQQRSIKHFTH